MKILRSKSKVIIPLTGAFVSLITVVLISWFIRSYYSQGVYTVLEQHTDNSEKSLIITELLEITHFRTRLTGQMLVTEDIFERDDIAQELDINATRFAVLRLKLFALPFSAIEKDIMDKQTQLIQEVLPRQRASVELAMSDDKGDVNKAQKILYDEVIPGQRKLANYFIDILKLLKNDIEQSSAKAITTNKNVTFVNLLLIFIFTLLTTFVATITIRRILRIETNFNKANAELTRLNNVKTEFISLVSHELRTPLTSIKSFAEILMDDIEDLDIDTQIRYLSIINSESDRLTRLVSNILDIQKIDANKMNWNDESLIINEIAQKSVETFSAAYQAKNITLNIATVPDDLTVIADADKLSQVFANLLSNALKFTSQGEVLVSIHQQKNKQNLDMAIVTVSDTGSGIPQEELLKVFDSFHQVDNSATRKSGGSGLGLDICRKIINHYEGNIWVESVLDKGSNFCFEIPLVKSTRKRIGDTLVDLGMITDKQLKIALKSQSN